MITIQSLLRNYWQTAFSKLGYSSNKGHRLLKRQMLHVERLEDRVVPATLLWLGTSKSTDYYTGGNWQVLVAAPEEGLPAQGSRSDRAPIASDTIKFSDSSDMPCILSATTPAANCVVASAIFEGYAGKLILQQSLTASGGLLDSPTASATDYTITGAGDFVIAKGATFTWKSGTMAGTTPNGVASGKTIVKSGAILNIESSNTDTQDARLAGRELVIEAADGSTAAGQVNFMSGRLFCQAAPVIAETDTVGRNALITNAGVFSITGTTAESIQGGSQHAFVNVAGGKVTLFNDVDISNGAAPSFEMKIGFYNNSTPTGAYGVEILKGRMRLGGGGDSTGSWRTADGTMLVFKKLEDGANPVFGWNSGSSFEGTSSSTVAIDKADIYLGRDGRNGITVSVGPKLWMANGGMYTSPFATTPTVLEIKNWFEWSGGEFVVRAGFYLS